MSIVVVVKKKGNTVMAADSQISFGSSRIPYENLRSEKITVLAGALFSSAGWGLYDDIIEDYVTNNPELHLDDGRSIFHFFMGLWKELHDKYSFVNDQCDDKESPFGDLDSSFLVANRRGLFQVGGDMSVTEFQQYYAIGSGSDYALGALHAVYDQDLGAAEIAERAVAAAIAFDTKCGGDTLIRNINELN